MWHASFDFWVGFYHTWTLVLHDRALSVYPNTVLWEKQNTKPHTHILLFKFKSMLCFIFRIIYSKFIPPFSFFPRRSCPEKDPETLCTLGTASIHFFSGLECIIYFFFAENAWKIYQPHKISHACSNRTWRCSFNGCKAGMERGWNLGFWRSRSVWSTCVLIRQLR